MSEQTALAAQLRAELEEVAIAVEYAERLLAKKRAPEDDEYIGSLALSVHSFYNGIERSFEMIARQVDGWSPKSPEWHRDLLLLMAAEVKSARPPVIARSTLRCLDAYRAFRHLVRHLYVFDLRPPRVRELAANMRGCYESAERDLLGFCDFLERIDSPD
jgi:hypothetical protein